MPQLFESMMPRAVCFAGDPALIALYLASSVTIGLAYMGFVVWGFALRGILHGFTRIILLAVAFVGCCGLGHFINALNVYAGMYWLETSWNALTAVISVAFLFEGSRLLRGIPQGAFSPEEVIRLRSIMLRIATETTDPAAARNLRAEASP